MISVYQPEQLILNGSVLVIGETSNPSLTINTTEQSYAGSHEYIIEYTNYLGRISEIPIMFVFVQTECISGLSGL